MRGEIKPERGAEWNTSGNLLKFHQLSQMQPFLFKKKLIHFLIIHSDLTARLSWIKWENLGVRPGRRIALAALSTVSSAQDNPY